MLPDLALGPFLARTKTAVTGFSMDSGVTECTEPLTLHNEFLTISGE